MARLAKLDVMRPGDRRPRRDQLGGIEQPRAVLALITARIGALAERAGADDVAIGQKAPVVRRISLPKETLLDPARRVERAEDLLRQRAVGGA